MRNAIFHVTLSDPSTQVVEVNYATVPGTAVPPSDYTSKSGTLVFLPGEVDKTVSVSVREDIPDRLLESFSLALSSPVNAAIIDPLGNATLAGWQSPPFMAVTGTQTIPVDFVGSVFIANNTGNPITVTLPSNQKTNQMLMIMDTAGNAGDDAITLVGAGGNLIGDTTTYVLNRNLQAVTLIWSGLRWNVTTAVADPTAAYTVQDGILARSDVTRFRDRINAKEYMLGNDAVTDSAMQTFSDTIAAGHLPDPFSQFIPHTARAGYIPGGKFRSLKKEIHSGGYGWTLRGDGPVSQLVDTSVILDYNDSHLESVRLSGISQTGIGVDIRAGQCKLLNVEVNNHEVGITNKNSFFPGGFASNQTIIGGWLRDNKIGVEIANADYRAIGQRIGGIDVACDYFDNGGIELVGCHLSAQNGPGLLCRGNHVQFTGNIVTGLTTITNIKVVAGDYSTIKPGKVLVGALRVEEDEVIPSSALQYQSRVVSVTPTMITLDRPVLDTLNDTLITLSEVPIESFFVGCTIGSSGNFLSNYKPVSIETANAGQSTLITFDKEHQLSMAMRAILSGTGVPVYDSDLNKGYIEAIPSSKSVQLSMPYNGPIVTPATANFAVQGDSAQYLSTGPSAAYIRALFTVAGNQNGSMFRGGANYSFIGTRLKTRMYMQGCRPFKADCSVGSNILSNMSIPSSEIRLNTHIALGTVLQAYSRVTEIVSPNSIRIDKLPLQDRTQATFRSPETSNNIFHVMVPDDQHGSQATYRGAPSKLRNSDAVFSGPGSLVGWSQVGHVRNGIASYDAVPGSFYVGMRTAYTEGGMKDNQPAVLNYLGMMNNGLRFNTNGIRYDVQGRNWYAEEGVINFQENGKDDVGGMSTDGYTYNPIGLPMFTTTRAYRNFLARTFKADTIIGGTTVTNVSIDATTIREGQEITGTAFATDTFVALITSPTSFTITKPALTTTTQAGVAQDIFANAIHRWQSPKRDTELAGTSTGGYAVVPGQADFLDARSLFLGACSDEPSLIGNAASLQKLQSSIEIRNHGYVSLWHSGREYVRLADTYSESFLRVDQDGPARFTIQNTDLGPNAIASLGVRNQIGIEAGFRLIVSGQNFTNGGTPLPYLPADACTLVSGTALSGGMSLVTFAGTMKTFVGSAPTLVSTMTNTAASFSVPLNAAWIDAINIRGSSAASDLRVEGPYGVTGSIDGKMGYFGGGYGQTGTAGHGGRAELNAGDSGSIGGHGGQTKVAGGSGMGTGGVSHGGDVWIRAGLSADSSGVAGTIKMRGPYYMHFQQTPATISTSSTLTPQQIKYRLVVTSGGADLTMPLGADLEAAYPVRANSDHNIETNDCIDFGVINTSGSACTMNLNTGITAVGNMTITANQSAGFRLQRTATPGVFVMYRTG